MDTTLARPPVGRLLDGRYRVESLIATGGMATVYLGTDTRLDRTVALKIMHAELANDEDFVRRFVGEARSVARLSHPNVVGVYDQGADGRTLYLAMEYVPGRTLRDLLNERGSLQPREALDIMEGVLGGLGAAHAAGLAHRDVKPENVLLTAEHDVKVADFGLARMLAGTSQTKTGMLIGTAAYLAPEQVSRGVADARTDVYAAGVMLFEMVTGQQPHTADTPLAVAYKHVNEAVPAPSQLVDGVPAALDELVLRATSRDPDLRPADGGQFARSLNEVRLSLPPAPPVLPAAPAATGYLDPGYPGPGYPGPGYQDPGHAGPGYQSAGYQSAGYQDPGYPGSGYQDPGYQDPGQPAGYPPEGWPAQPPPYVDDLVPGLRAPGEPAAAGGVPPADAPTSVGAAFPTSGSSAADSSTSAFSVAEFGLPPVEDRAAVTQRGPDDGFHRAAANHTMVVAPGAITDYSRGRGGYGGPREPGLQRWLFSRRLYYVLGGLAAVLLVGAARLVAVGGQVHHGAPGGWPGRGYRPPGSPQRGPDRDDGQAAVQRPGGQGQHHRHQARGRVPGEQGRHGDAHRVRGPAHDRRPPGDRRHAGHRAGRAASRGPHPGQGGGPDVHHHRERDRDQHHPGSEPCPGRRTGR